MTTRLTYDEMQRLREMLQISRKDPAGWPFESPVCRSPEGLCRALVYTPARLAAVLSEINADEEDVWRVQSFTRELEHEKSPLAIDDAERSCDLMRAWCARHAMRLALAR